MIPLPAVHWSLGGVPVPMSDWSCNVRANGGHDQARGTIPERVARRLSGIDQGAILTAMLPSGRVLWHGRISAQPKLTGGLVGLQAEGLQAIVRGQTARRLYQSRDYGLWADAAPAPYNRVAAASMRASIADNQILFEVAAATVNQNDACPVQCWGQGGTSLQRVTFTIVTNVSGSYVIRIQGAAGPDGVAGTATDIAPTTTPKVQAVTLSPALDSIVMSLVRTGVNTTTETRVLVRISDLRVNDRATSDYFTCSQVASDVGGFSSLDVSNVIASPVNVLPLDWNSTNHGDLLDYVATIDDFRWLVLEDRGKGAALEYGPWARTWYTNSRFAHFDDLVTMPKIDTVTVTYQGSVGIATTGVPKPIVYVDPKSAFVSSVAPPAPAGGATLRLHDHQIDDQLARAVAAAQAQALTRTRATGQVPLAAVRDVNGYRSPYEVLAGDVLVCEDWGPAQAQGLRIYDIEYRPDGVTATIESPFTADGILAELSSERMRWPLRLAKLPEAGDAA